LGALISRKKKEKEKEMNQRKKSNKKNNSLTGRPLNLKSYI
jgi:hypothetical protein